MELKGGYKHHYLKRKSHCKHKDGKSVFKNTSAIEEDSVSNDRLKELVMQQPISVAMYSSKTL
jgi:hypothetical protein